MFNDPIVKEIRKAGMELAEEAGGNTHRFFERLRDSQKLYKKRLVKKLAKKLSTRITT